MGVIWPSAVMFRMVASLITAAGAAPCSLSISSLSDIVACCAVAADTETKRNEPTARKLSSGCFMSSSPWCKLLCNFYPCLSGYHRHRLHLDSLGQHDC